MNPNLLAAPVVLSFAQWNAIISALQFLPGMVAQPIVAGIQGQVNAEAPKEAPAST